MRTVCHGSSSTYRSGSCRIRTRIWTQTVPSPTARLIENVFAAFSIGARVCAGKATAYLEASLVITMTLWYFDLEEAHGYYGSSNRRRGVGHKKGYGILPQTLVEHMSIRPIRIHDHDSSILLERLIMKSSFLAEAILGTAVHDTAVGHPNRIRIVSQPVASHLISDPSGRIVQTSKLV